MKPAPFEYLRAGSLEETLHALSTHGEDIRVLAGGQSLVPMLNMRLAGPDILLDINGVSGLTGIEINGGNIRVGAMTRYREIASSPVIAKWVPLLPFALTHVAHRAIRNRGTLGGSMALADPAAEMPACALALDATVIVQSVRGERRIAANDFIRGVWETALARDELITAVEYPASSSKRAFSFLEFARRHGDFALAGVVAVANANDNVRVVTFGVGQRAFRSPGVEQWLTGASGHAILPPEIEAQYAEDVEAAAAIESDASFRVSIATTLLKRALPIGASGPGE